MLSLVLLPIVGIVIGIIIGTRRGNIFPYTMAGAFFGFIGGILLSLTLTGIIPETTSSKMILLREVRLHSLGDASATSGKFFLGIGSFESQDYYKFYQEVGQAFYAGKVPVIKSAIYEENRQDGVLEIYARARVVRHKPLPKLLYAFSFRSSDTLQIEQSEYLSEDLYEFHVPKNSVSQEFRVN